MPIQKRFGAISIHSSHTGRDEKICDGRSDQAISIHSSHTGRDVPAGCCTTVAVDFNPLFPYGKRRRVNNQMAVTRHFNPLFPYGKRRVCTNHFNQFYRFQSTLPIREETIAAGGTSIASVISIHSSHTGRDHDHAGFQQVPDGISIHSSHTGRDRHLDFRHHDKILISIHSSHTGRDHTRLI